jgi:hypothetical protein
MIEAELAEERLAGVLEPPPVRGLRKAVFVVAVDRGVARLVADKDDRALLVRVEVRGLVERRAGIGEQRGVVAGPVDVAAGHRARAVIFRDEVVAVVEEPGGAGAERHLVEPAERVVGERRPVRARHQPVLDVVAVAAEPVRYEIAVGIVADGGSAGRGSKMALLPRRVRCAEGSRSLN